MKKMTLFFSFLFLQFNLVEASPYLQDRLSESDKRYSSFSKALELLEERQAKTIVETGTSRFGDKEFGGDGGSTIILGHWAKKNGAKLYSIDHNSTAIEKAKEATTPYEKNIQYCLSDSVKYLKKFKQPIDFIYLDSHEFDFGNPLPSQEHHLREIVTAYPFLHKESVIMIDDCDLPDEGQGKLVIEFLLDNGWKCYHKGYQTILIQE